MESKNLEGGRAGFGVQGAVFVLSLGLMLFELSLTRVLSVLYYYHTAFLAISIAMLGLGAGGLFSYLAPAFTWRHKIPLLAGSAISMGLLPLLYPVVSLDLASLDEFTGFSFLLSLSLTAFAIVIPFVGGGMLLALLLSRYDKSLSKLYALDLCGAAVACLALIPWMELLGGTGALFASGFVVASTILFLSGFSFKRVAPAFFLLLLVLIQLRFAAFPLEVDLELVGGEKGEILSEHWNAHSRVVVVDHVGWDRGRSELKSFEHSDSNPKQLDALIDINAYAPMVAFDGDLERVSNLKDLVSNIGYRIAPKGFEVVIIGPGGGKDVVGALLFGASHVTGIEINPIIVEDLVQGEFKDFTGDIYGQKNVDIIVGDGRSELSRIDKQFDFIVANSVATWAAHSSGAMNLAETSLFTVEAFQEYRKRLTPDGILSISLWDEVQHALPMRLIRTWATCFEEEFDVSGSVAVLGNRWGDGRWFTSVLLSNRPFSPSQIQTLSQAAKVLDFDPLYLPGLNRTPLAPYVRDFNQYSQVSDHNIDPATDDQPFFFYTLPFLDALQFWRPSIVSDNTAWASLAVSLFVIAVLVGILFYLPLRRVRRMVSARDRLTLLEQVFFCAIGAGFMFIEISLLQRLSLFLGHPTFALTVGLAGLLAWTGVGAKLSGIFSKKWAGENWLEFALYGLLLVVAVFSYLVPTPGAWAATWTSPQRVGLVLLYLAPIGVSLGIPMAAAMGALGTNRRDTIAWAWGLNGASGVLASVVAIVVAITMGFTASYFLGWLFYLCAALAWKAHRMGERSVKE